MKASGLSAGTVTVSHAGQNISNISVAIDEFSSTDITGTDGSGAIVQSATGSGNAASSSVTLAAFGDATNNAAYGISGNAGSQAITPDATATWTELSEDAAHRLETQWKLGQDTTVTSSWSTAKEWGAIAIEIKAAGAVTVTAPVGAATADSVAPGVKTGLTGVGVATADSAVPGAAVTVSLAGGTENVGYTTVGASTDNIGGDVELVSQATPAQAGTINLARAYLDGNGTGVGSQACKFIVYSDNAGSPDALLGVSDEVTVADGQAAAWVDFTFSTPIVLSDANPIWIGLFVGDSAVPTIQARYTAPGPTSSKYDVQTYGTAPDDPWVNSGNIGQTYSWYVAVDFGTSLVGAATADSIAPTVTTDFGPTPPPGVATADAVVPGLAIAFTVPTAAAAVADAVSPVVAVHWNLTSPAGIATAEATAASLAVALVSPVGTATADASAPSFLQRLITILEVVITQPRALGSALYERVLSYTVTQPQSLGSTIHQRILAPVITAARDLTSSIFRN